MTKSEIQMDESYSGNGAVPLRKKIDYGKYNNTNKGQYILGGMWSKLIKFWIIQHKCIDKQYIHLKNLNSKYAI